MEIFALNPSHDGHIALIRDGRLEFSIESEKDNGERYSPLSTHVYLRAMKYMKNIPDVIALTGQARFSHAPQLFSEPDLKSSPPMEGGYFGEREDCIVSRKQNLFGKEVDFFSSSHERAHIFCSYGMSPFPQGKPCYALVWEGALGSFYKIDEKVNIKKIGDVLEAPGNKYQLPYCIADQSFPDWRVMSDSSAGKMMALASFANQKETLSKQDELFIEDIFSKKTIMFRTKKGDFCNSKYYNIGVESSDFKQLARRVSDKLFDLFFNFAKENLKEGLPLLISGGCGLNCDWNSAWKSSGLFEDVFIPPCPNDSGTAIGTAIDGLRHHSGQAKVTWSVYSGEPFIIDKTDMDGIECRPLNLKDVARFLNQGRVIAWVQNRYEIGPRALGNRSILAMPFSRAIHRRLNKIKNRESFRPIAPVCLEEDINLHFDNHGPSPYMLFFQKVTTDQLPAITHVDGSARIQSVTKHQNQELHALLSAFKEISGFGVLCNTSLNFNGAGFINRLSDLVKYCRSRELDGFVVNDKFYIIKNI